MPVPRLAPRFLPGRRVTRWVTTALALLAAACQDPVRPTPAPHVAARPAHDVAPVALQPWELDNPATNHEIEGYASAPSVNVGETIQFFVNTASPQYTVAVYRMGWYGGTGAQLVYSTPAPLTGTVQPTPAPDASTGLAECRWTNPVTVPALPTWKSGVYLAKLTTVGGATPGKGSYVLFVVREDARASDFLVNVSINTYQAYNNWGGKSLYNFNSTDGQAAVKVSLSRPYAAGPTPNSARGVGAGEFLTNVQPDPNGGGGAAWEYNMVRYLDQNGYDVTYTTDYDVGVHPERLKSHRAFLTVGHDEYWTMGQRNGILAARDAGVHLGFFSSNTGYWQVRFEPSPSGAAGRTMVGYKYNYDPVPDQTLETTQFRLLSPPLPENQILGIMYNDDIGIGDLVIDDASTWVTAGTGVTTGTVLPGLMGYESDALTTPVNATERRIAHSPNPWGGSGYSDMSVYTAPSGAQVFAAGTMRFSWGLDDYNAPAIRSSYLSSQAQAMMRNILTRFRTPPVAPAPGGAAPVATVLVTLPNRVLALGQTTQATAAPADSFGNALAGRAVTWASSNPGVATVSPTGLVTAVTQGTATITATSGGVTGSAPLNAGGGSLANAVGTNLCAAVVNEATTVGASVVTWACNPTLGARRFLLLPSGVLTLEDGTRCLDTGNGKAGTAVVIATCTGAARQVWTQLSTGQLVSSGKQCLTVAYEDAVAGRGLVLWPCDGSSAQRWTVPSLAAPITTTSGLLVSGVGLNLCGAVVNESTQRGAAVVTWTCDPTLSARRFLLTSAGALTVEDGAMCLDVMPPKAKGAAVVTWTCAATEPTQHWTLTASGQLTNVQGLCLTVAYEDKTPGRGLVLSTCDGSPAQKWTVLRGS